MLSNNVLVRINTAEGNHVRISTFDRDDGHSPAFYISKDKLRELFAAPDGQQMLDYDCGNWLRAYMERGMVRMEFTWIWHACVRRQWVYLDAADLEALIYGRCIVRRLSKEPSRQAEITLRESAHALIATLNKRERRALSKALRDSFQWPGDHVTLSRDWGKDFWFSADGIHGGLCRSHYNGKITYSVHT